MEPWAKREEPDPESYGFTNVHESTKATDRREILTLKMGSTRLPNVSFKRNGIAEGTRSDRKKNYNGSHILRPDVLCQNHMSGNDYQKKKNQTLHNSIKKLGRIIRR
jgi:hypothetical protein